MTAYALPRVLSRNGMIYTQTTRCHAVSGEDYCIYKVTMESAATGKLVEIGYEVIRVLIRKEALFTNKKTGIQTITKEHEGYPGSNEFGMNGWSYRHLADAERKLYVLLNTQKKKNKS